jgi:hypothetical protein
MFPPYEKTTALPCDFDVEDSNSRRGGKLKYDRAVTKQSLKAYICWVMFTSVLTVYLALAFTTWRKPQNSDLQMQRWDSSCEYGKSLLVFICVYTTICILYLALLFRNFKQVYRLFPSRREIKIRRRREILFGNPVMLVFLMIGINIYFKTKKGLAINQDIDLCKGEPSQILQKW